MSRPHEPDDRQAKLALADEIDALYRQGEGAEPDAELDRRILAAARREVESARARPRPGGWRWLTAGSALVVALLGVSLAWRVADEETRQLPTTGRGDEGSSPGAKQDGASGQPGAPAERAASAEAKARAQAPAPARPAKPAPPVAFPAAPAAGSATLPEAESREADKSASDSARVAEPAAQNEAAVSARRGKAAPGEERQAAPQAVAPAPGPQVLLREIRELRAAGRFDEAAAVLKRLRALYPDYIVPDDLK